MSGSPDEPTQPVAPPTEPVAPDAQPVAPPGAPPARRTGNADLRPIAIGVGAALLVLLVAGVAFAAARLGALGTTSEHPGPVVQYPGPGNGPHDLRPGGPGGDQRGPSELRKRAFQGERQGGGIGAPGGLIGLRQITISAISGSDVTVGTPDGWTRTINVGSTTTVKRAGQTIAVADLKVGDEIRFQEQRNADGTFSMTAIEVVLPRVTGQVSATTSDTITVQRPDGTTMTIHVGSATTYQVRGVANATISDITPGMLILAQGTQNADGSLQAIAVYAASRH